MSKLININALNIALNALKAFIESNTYSEETIKGWISEEIEKYLTVKPKIVISESTFVAGTAVSKSQLDTFIKVSNGDLDSIIANGTEADWYLGVDGINTEESKLKLANTVTATSSGVQLGFTSYYGAAVTVYLNKNGDGTYATYLSK